MKILKYLLNKINSLSILLPAGILFFIGIFIKLTLELNEDNKVVLLDQEILIFISKFRFSLLNEVAVELTTLGSSTFIIFFTSLLFIFFFVKKDYLSCSYLATANLGGGALTFLAKEFFSRPRPEVVPRLVEVTGFSYPSGHSISSTVFYLLLVFLFLRITKEFKIQILVLSFAILIISLVSFSRLYLGVHYPSDVVSGISLGASWILFLSYFYQLQLKKSLVGN